MPVTTETVTRQTQGNGDIHDITVAVQDAVARSPLTAGAATVFVVGATAALTTIEYEPGLIEDMVAAFERLAPRDITYQHEMRRHDGNGHSHIRASLLGPSLTVPFVERELVLGFWQQIILIDFDTRPRRREVVVQMIGE